MALTIKTLKKVCFLNFGYVLEVLGQWPVVTKMSSLKEKTLRQRRFVTAEDLEEWSVNSLAELEAMAKEEKWDGRHLLATPIHRMSETGAIASSEWFLMVGLFSDTINLLTKPWHIMIFSGEGSSNQDQGVCSVGGRHRQGPHLQHWLSQNWCLQVIL